MHRMKVDENTIKQQQKALKEKLKNFKTANLSSITITLPMEIKDHEKAILEFTQEAIGKIKALVRGCNKEIAWHGTVEKTIVNKQAVYTVGDVFMFPQEVTAATVKGIPDKYAIWNAQLPDEIYNKMRFHGHSHVNMGVTPSGVDTNYQDEMIETLEDFYVFIIINKRDEIWAKIVDVNDNIVYEKADIIIRVQHEDAYDAWAAESIDTLLTEPAPVVHTVHSTPSTYQQMALSQIEQRKKQESEEDRYGGWGRYADDWYRGYMG